MGNQSFNSPLGSNLSVGNVVSAGLRIYRDNFKHYYLLALKASLWILIPIYGWAKYAMLLGLISRLAFSQVTENPETEAEARSHVQPNLWIFFTTGLFVGFIFLGFLFLAIIIPAFIIGIIIGIVGQNPAGVAIAIILGIILFIVFLFAYIWLYSRLAIAELPIAIDNVKKASSAIGKSWQLTKGYVGKLQLIFFVAILISFPLSFLANIFGVVLEFLPEDVQAIGNVINLAISIPISALLIPFWQSIKAIIYYDLRYQKEGLGLNLRKS